MLLHQTVSNQAERCSDAKAVVLESQSLTYGELEQAGNRLAYLLRAAGCRKGDRVALLMPKSIPAFVGMLGCLKAGCIYVPMDTGSPVARLEKMMAVSEPACIIASADAASLIVSLLRSEALKDPVPVGWMEQNEPAPGGIDPIFCWSDLSSAPDHRPLGTEQREEDVAHILFTSGSTGVPKGVAITHSNVSHFLTWASRYFGMNASDRVAGHSPLHFDLSTFDVWGSFLAGAELHPITADVNLVPGRIAEFIRYRKLTHMLAVPSVLKYMAEFDVVQFDDFPCLKRLLWCGEKLPTATLRYWMERLPGARFTNLYGPTETTIASSYYTVPARPEDDRADIPVGRACEGEELFVLDEVLQPTPAGEIGEVYIGGVGLSPGYWREPEKTAAAFVSDARRGRIYKTGDLARIGDDGLINLLGRADSQIKSRGYRIELGEIETAINSLPIVRESAVVAIQSNTFEGMVICCAYVPPSGVEVKISELMERVREALPSYMMPQRWMALDALPLNRNGKVDRPLLKAQFTNEGKLLANA